jgi:hypothetical protein
MSEGDLAVYKRRGLVLVLELPEEPYDFLSWRGIPWPSPIAKVVDGTGQVYDRIKLSNLEPVKAGRVRDGVYKHSNAQHYPVPSYFTEFMP